MKALLDFDFISKVAETIVVLLKILLCCYYSPEWGVNISFLLYLSFQLYDSHLYGAFAQRQLINVNHFLKKQFALFSKCAVIQ